LDFKTLMSSLFGFSAPTFYSWKKEKRPIILLVEKYFEKKELIEFLNTKKIHKLELIKEYSLDELQELLNKNQIIDKISVNNHLNNFDRVSLIYFLYLFKKEDTVKDSTTLYNFITNNLKKPDSIIISKVFEYISGYKPTWLKDDNVSLRLHINNFNEDCNDYIKDDELDYIFKHREYYFDFISRKVEKKR
jgi:hypothetical protein